MNDIAVWAHLAPAIKGTPPCPSSYVPDDCEDFADFVEAEWTGMEADGPLWITEAIDELVGGDRKEVNVPALCRPELDTHGMAPGALLQVLFGRAHVADRDMLAAAKALREMLQAYGDGEAERRANHTITMMASHAASDAGYFE